MGKRWVKITLAIVASVALFPISARVADPLFTSPWSGGFDKNPVLLVWPDHVEIRWFHDLSQVSPRPVGSGYTFNVAPERQAWVEKQVRGVPSPVPLKSAWMIHVKQLGSGKQKVQLELMGDGYYGIVYEAGPNAIVPIGTRLTGPGGAFTILAVHLLLWGAICGTGWTAFRLMRGRRKELP